MKFKGKDEPFEHQGNNQCVCVLGVVVGRAAVSVYSHMHGQIVRSSIFVKVCEVIN